MLKPGERARGLDGDERRERRFEHVAPEVRWTLEGADIGRVWSALERFRRLQRGLHRRPCRRGAARIAR